MTLADWVPATPAPPLGADEVHVWRIPLSTSPRRRDWLSEDERERADKFVFDRHREDFVAGRSALRSVLAGYLGCAPAEVRFAYGERGKPSVAGLEFNLSHSGGLALLAVSRDRVLGVDVERVRPDMDHEGVARRFFSTREVASFVALPSEQRVDAFFRCWTRKEAYVKACGSGLYVALDAFDVTLTPHEPAAFLEIRGDDRDWRMAEVHPGEGYFGALVVEGDGWSVSGFQVGGSRS